MNDTMKDLLKEADIPERLWERTSAEIVKVLRRTAETGNPRPTYLQLASELTGADLENRRLVERRKKANYRRRQRAKAAGAKPG